MAVQIQGKISLQDGESGVIVHCCKLSRHGSIGSGSKLNISIVTMGLLSRQDPTTAIALKHQTKQSGVWPALAELHRQQSGLLHRQSLDLPYLLVSQRTCQ